MSKSESLRPNDENCLRNGLMFLPFGSSWIVKMGWVFISLLGYIKPPAIRQVDFKFQFQKTLPQPKESPVTVFSNR